jgi:2-oxoglutarate ferredoxin oxidoreductase subunit delta
MRQKSEVKLVINAEWCKGCGICVAFCPKQVLKLNRKEKAEAARIEACTACRMCERRCPDLAIEVSIPQSQVERAA